MQFVFDMLTRGHFLGLTVIHLATTKAIAHLIEACHVTPATQKRRGKRTIRRHFCAGANALARLPPGSVLSLKLYFNMNEPGDRNDTF